MLIRFDQVSLNLYSSNPLRGFLEGIEGDSLWSSYGYRVQLIWSSVENWLCLAGGFGWIFWLESPRLLRRARASRLRSQQPGLQSALCFVHNRTFRDRHHWRYFAPHIFLSFFVSGQVCSIPPATGMPFDGEVGAVPSQTTH